MRFRTTEGVALSANGQTAVLTARPDRGDPEGLVVSIPDAATVSVPRGTAGAVSSDGRFAAFRVVPPLAALERARRQRRDAPPNGLAVVEVSARRTAPTVPNVKAFAFARTARHLVFHLGTPERPARDTTARDTAAVPRRDSLQRVAPATKRTEGTALVARALDPGTDAVVHYVAEGWALSDDGTRLAYAVAGRDSTQDALFVRTLATGETARLHGGANTVYRHLTWSKAGRLAALATPVRRDGTPGPATLLTWDGGAEASPVALDTSGGWVVPAGNRLVWTDDGQRLFFGLQPRRADASRPDTTFAGLDTDALLRGRLMDVWHERDGRIQPQQKKRWADEQKRVWLAVLHPDGPHRPPRQRRRRPRRDPAERADGPAIGVGAVRARDVVGRHLRRPLRGGSCDGPPTRASRPHASARRGSRPMAATWSPSTAGTTHRHPHAAVRRLSDGLGVVLTEEEYDTPDDAPAYGLGGSWTTAPPADPWAAQRSSTTATTCGGLRSRRLRRCNVTAARAGPPRPLPHRGHRPRAPRLRGHRHAFG